MCFLCFCVLVVWLLLYDLQEDHSAGEGPKTAVKSEQLSLTAAGGAVIVFIEGYQ
jgi:hypothetical protein